LTEVTRKEQSVLLLSRNRSYESELSNAQGLRLIDYDKVVWEWAPSRGQSVNRPKTQLG
jgi:hypothetical protein